MHSKSKRILFILMCILFCSSLSLAATDQRTALVIGNSAYSAYSDASCHSIPIHSATPGERVIDAG